MSLIHLKVVLRKFEFLKDRCHFFERFRYFFQVFCWSVFQQFVMDPIRYEPKKWVYKTNTTFTPMLLSIVLKMHWTILSFFMFSMFEVDVLECVERNLSNVKKVVGTKVHILISLSTQIFLILTFLCIYTFTYDNVR